MLRECMDRGSLCICSKGKRDEGARRQAEVLKEPNIWYLSRPAAEQGVMATRFIFPVLHLTYLVGAGQISESPQFASAELLSDVIPVFHKKCLQGSLTWEIPCLESEGTG